MFGLAALGEMTHPQNGPTRLSGPTRVAAVMEMIKLPNELFLL